MPTSSIRLLTLQKNIMLLIQSPKQDPSFEFLTYIMIARAIKLEGIKHTCTHWGIYSKHLVENNNAENIACIRSTNKKHTQMAFSKVCLIKSNT